MSAISSILTVVKPGGRPQPERPSITPTNVHNNDKTLSPRTYFQYWPEDIQVSKKVNWETKNIPGLSHPLYQWISGGAREITFTAIFTCDQAPSANTLSLLNNQDTTTNSLVGALRGTVASPFSDVRNVDIPSAIQWLESYLYPEYTADGISGRASTPLPRPKPPRKLILTLPGMRLGQRVDHMYNDDVLCIMMQCEVTYGAFFADGTPRIAKASLQFAEIIQYQNKVNVQDAFALRAAGNFGYRLTRGPSDQKK